MGISSTVVLSYVLDEYLDGGGWNEIYIVDMVVILDTSRMLVLTLLVTRYPRLRKKETKLEIKR